MGIFDRTERMVGPSPVKKLKETNIIVFGVGGVGSYVIEALARAGVGKLTIVDKDIVDETNINRQLIALHSTVGKPKVEVAQERLLDINPNLQVKGIQECFNADSLAQFDLSEYDYIVDAIDMVSSKLLLIETAKELGIPIISSMGMGNKLHPELIEIADIAKTKVDPLAKVMRLELKKRGIKKVPVVFSTEKPLVRVTPPGSISTVPSSAGLMIASYVINDLISTEINTDENV